MHLKIVQISKKYQYQEQLQKSDYDAAKISRKPLVVSHSAAGALSTHYRAKSDEAIAAVAAIAAIVLSVIGKNKERNFKIARLVAAGSLIVGMSNAFMF